MMPCTLVLRSGSRVRAERVLRDGGTLHALVRQTRVRVREDERIAYREPAGLVWREYRARDVRRVVEGPPR
jgi:hypothetical protein